MHAAAVQSALPSPRAPGHWVLARLGKRVLRPGGLEATNLLLDALAVCSADDVVEFAPGLGVTARRLLALRPASYVAVERDEAAASRLDAALAGPTARIVRGCAEDSGLPASSASIVIGEAMLTMQSTEKKKAIIAEAARILRRGGRYGIHEIALQPEDIDDSVRQQIRSGMSKAIHHGVMPQTVGEWRALLGEAGFVDLKVSLVPFKLLEPARLVADEGILGAARFAFNMLRMPDARRRALEMRRTFRAHARHLTAVAITAEKG